MGDKSLRTAGGKIRHIWLPGAARQRPGENGWGRRAGELRDFQPARGSESKIPRRGGDSPSHRPGRPPAGGGAAGPSRAPLRAGPGSACVPCPVCPVCPVPVSRVSRARVPCPLAVPRARPCPGGAGRAVTRGPVISRLGGVSRDFPERRCLPAAPLPAQPPSLSPQAGGRPRADMDEQFQPVSAARIGPDRTGAVAAGSRPRSWAGDSARPTGGVGGGGLCLLPGWEGLCQPPGWALRGLLLPVSLPGERQGSVPAPVGFCARTAIACPG